jgi:hypothetical protein
MAEMKRGPGRPPCPAYRFFDRYENKKTVADCIKCGRRMNSAMRYCIWHAICACAAISPAEREQLREDLTNGGFHIPEEEPVKTVRKRSGGVLCNRA